MCMDGYLTYVRINPTHGEIMPRFTISFIILRAGSTDIVDSVKNIPFGGDARCALYVLYVRTYYVHNSLIHLLSGSSSCAGCTRRYRQKTDRENENMYMKYTYLHCVQKLITCGIHSVIKKSTRTYNFCLDPHHISLHTRTHTLSLSLSLYVHFRDTYRELSRSSALS